MKKILKYTLRVLLGILVFLVVTLIGGYLYLNTAPGRRWMNEKITSYLENKLGTKVQIREIEFELPIGLKLHNVVIQDHHHLTLISFNEGELQFARFTPFAVVLGNLEVSGMQFNLIHYKNEKESNFQMVMDRFASTDTTSKGPDIYFNNVVLNHVNFHWDGQNDSLSKDPGIDWGHIDISDFNTHLESFHIGKDITGIIQSMNFSEKSGFKLLDLRTTLLLSAGKMEYKNLYLKTPETELRDYISFNYDDYSKFGNFIDSVKFKGNFIDSKVSMKDIAFFTTALTNKKDIVAVNSLNTDGTIADMRVHNFNLNFGDSSYAVGSGSMKGLPNIDETYIDVRMKRSRSSRKELMRILPETALPEDIDKLGIVSMKGSFTGFINDFVAYGNANTALGEVVSDINLKMGKTMATSTYSGKIALNNFDLGRLFSVSYLGKATVSGAGEGTGFTADALRARLQASVQRFDLNGYSYSGIQLNGEVSKKFFTGELNSLDKNLDLNFRGTVDYKQSLPLFAGNIDIRNADLMALKISNDSLVVKSQMSFNFRGLQIDSIQGNIHARGTSIRTKGKSYAFDTLALNSSIDSLNKHNITLYSDILNANMSGRFQPSKLPEFLKSLASQYLDSSFLHLKNAKDIKNQDLAFDINFRDMEFLFRLMHQDIKVKDSGYVRGTLSSKDAKVHIEGSLPGVKYGIFSAENIKINADSKDKYLALNITSDGIYRKDSLFLRDFTMSSMCNSNRFKFNINTSDSDYTRSVHLNGTLDVAGTTGYLTLDSSKLIIADSVWNVTSKRITIEKIDSFIDVPLLEFEHKNQRLKVVGKYSKKGDFPIRIIVEDVGLQMISNLVPQVAYFKGDMNGQILISGINKKPIVEAGIFVSPLIYKQDTLGIFGTTANFNNENQKLTIEGTLKNYLTQDELININGGINFAGKQDVNLNVKFIESPVQIFSPLLSGVSNLHGTASADMKITGKLSEPNIEGKIAFNNASMLIDYLQTTYHFTHEFAFSGKTITIKDLNLYDINDHLAKVDGKLTVNKLSDINLNLNMGLKDFQLLNTSPKDNNLYYGQAYGSGNIQITGPLEHVHMRMQLTTNQGTKFFLPIGRDNSYGTQDYITFVDHRPKSKHKHEDGSTTGIDLTMELNVTPDAAMQIIFDPRVGDIMEGNGHGNLKLDISTDGDFNINGTYYIDKGSYQFTALDLPLKKFSVKEGSEVRFQGTPYDAQLNVQAIYKVRTSLAPLMSSATLNTGGGVNPTSGVSNDIANNRVVNVETQLDLKGSLLTPTIKLNFEVPELNSMSNYSSDIDNQMKKIKSDEPELNKQVVALLVLGRFVEVNQGFTGAPSTSSLTDLVNSQVNSWLSHIAPGVNIGVDVHGGGANTYRASADLLNSRINLSGTYDQNISRNATYDASVSYKIKEDGSLLVKASSRSSNNPVLQTDNVNTYGLGIFIRKEFNSFWDLFRSKKKINQEKKSN